MKRKLAARKQPVVGVLGCMAERLKTKLLESDKMVDLVAGPDAYRDLPDLITAVQVGRTPPPHQHARLCSHAHPCTPCSCTVFSFVVH